MPAAVPGAAVLTMGGTLQAYGVTAGGALTLAAPSVLIGDGVTTNAPVSILHAGFPNYTITGYDGVTVAPGTQVNVVDPGYHFTAASYEVPTGTAPSAALSVWTPPLYTKIRSRPCSPNAPAPASRSMATIFWEAAASVR